MSITNRQSFANPAQAFWNTGAPDLTPLNSFIRKYERMSGGGMNSATAFTIATDGFTAPFSGRVVIVATASFTYTGATPAPVLRIILEKPTPTTASASNQAVVSNGNTESVSCILSFPITTGDNIGLNFKVGADSANPNTTYSNASWIIYVCS